MQKTTFPYELVIGEDCSIDGTREIVSEYAQKHAEIIRVVSSETNVGMKENYKRIINEFRGQYLAICEGDDYWIDPFKLQKQYETIKCYDAILVAHNTIELILQDGNVIRTRLRVLKKESGYIKPDDIILSNINIQTSSFFLKDEIIHEVPEWFSQAPVGDVPLKMLAASLGKIYYIDEIMSVYQHGTPGSWTDRSRKIDKKDPQQSRFILDYIKMFKNYDIFTEYKYHDAVRERSLNFLIKQVFYAENKEFINIPKNQKRTIDLIVYLNRFLPDKPKQIIQKMVTAYLVDHIL